MPVHSTTVDYVTSMCKMRKKMEMVQGLTLTRLISYALSDTLLVVVTVVITLPFFLWQGTMHFFLKWNTAGYRDCTSIYIKLSQITLRLPELSQCLS